MTFVPTGSTGAVTIATGTPERFSLSSPVCIKQAIRLFVTGDGIPAGREMFLKFGDSAVNAAIGDMRLAGAKGVPEVFGVPRGATHVSLYLNGGGSLLVSVTAGELA